MAKALRSALKNERHNLGRRPHVNLTREETRALCSHAAKAFVSPSMMVELIIRQWLAAPRAVKPVLTGRTADAVALHREKIVKRLIAARARIAQRGGRLNDAAAELLRALRREGVELSRSTLLSWHNRYASRGVVGLIDRRSIRVRSRIESGSGDN